MKLQSDNRKIVCKTKIIGHSGETLNDLQLNLDAIKSESINPWQEILFDTYEYEISVPYYRYETPEEFAARLAKENKARKKAKAKKIKNEDKEFALYLKLKEKFETK